MEAQHQSIDISYLQSTDYNELQTLFMGCSIVCFTFNKLRMHGWKELSLNIYNAPTLKITQFQFSSQIQSLESVVHIVYNYTSCGYEECLRNQI